MYLYHTYITLNAYRKTPTYAYSVHVDYNIMSTDDKRGNKFIH